MAVLGEMKRLLTRWNFFVTITVIFAIQAFGFFQYLKSFPGATSHPTANEAVFYTYLATQLFLPLAIGLLVGDTVAYDRSTGVIRFMLFRVSRAKYVWYKTSSAGLLAFLTVFSTLLLSGTIMCLSLPITHSTSNVNPYTLSAVHFLPHLFLENIFLYVVLSSGYTAFCAFFLGVLSAFLGIIQKNTFISVAFPWFVYIGLSIFGISTGMGIIAPLIWSTIVEYSPSVQIFPWIPPLVWILASAAIAMLSMLFIRRDIVD